MLLVRGADAPIGERDQICDRLYFFPFVKGDAVAVFDQQAAGRVLIVMLDFLVQFFQEVVHLVGVAVLEQRQELVAAVAPHKTHVGGGEVQNIGKIPDQLIALHMPVVFVGVMDIGQVEHDAAQILRYRFVQIFFNHNVAAETVGNPGQGVGVDCVVKLPVILMGGRKVVKIPVNKDEGQRKRQPEKDAEYTDGGVRSDQMVDPLIEKDDAKAAGRQQDEQDQLDGFIDKIRFFHGWFLPCR